MTLIERVELYEESITLAKEYIKRAEATLKKTDDESLHACGYSKENASTKRMSMELSNVLVKIRRGL